MTDEKSSAAAAVDYHALARQQVAAEELARIEAAVDQLAGDLRRADEERARLATLAVEHGLPADASPRVLADAMRRREDGFWSGFMASGGLTAGSRFRALAVEVGLDPATAERGAVWAAMRAQGHPLTRATFDPATGAMHVPDVQSIPAAA